MLKLIFMRIIQFLKSGAFIRQMLLALIIVAILLFLLINFLDYRTRHGEKISVPDLDSMKLEVAQTKLEELGLEIAILDTVDYNKSFPPFSIVEQEPKSGEYVKDGRSIYVKINAGGYEIIKMPDLKEKTYRQLQATIRALGLREGTVEYKPNLAKDLVLEVKNNGKTLKKGDKILKNSVIDFVLGDGKRVFTQDDLEKLDTISDAPIDDIDLDAPNIGQDD